ncbi:hypothetical protein [Paraburkholderia tagetis]|uniref:Uncharacterized protein n=1 Tax=Paraburkholderia tagetis TaxID=2913261 RepID=A0A9X1RMB9_9BURK|nr:hypothetical protein [Paraburkholderia tagetis]MCG5072182.1 hypothetical protein [Paraburkholderia tagetis]
MLHETYVQSLTAMFLFWNSARLLTYVPAIVMLLKKDADVRSHSLLTWGGWALSNATFALMLLEQNHGIPDRMFWMNGGNTLMCLLTFAVIFTRRRQMPVAWSAKVGTRSSTPDFAAVARGQATGNAPASSPHHWAGLAVVEKIDCDDRG